MSDFELYELRRRVDDLERRLAALDGGGAPAPAPTIDPEIQESLSRGNLIGAIKRYRELTGAGLAEAKSAVERMQHGT